MGHGDFPWRLLGQLLVERELLTTAEVERALAEQRRSGRRLGQILVTRGHLSPFSLARVLAEQHGVELQGAPVEPDGLPELVDRPWEPLGRLLVARGLVTAPDLEAALAEQARLPGRRLGEILVSRERLTGLALASALAEQHGVAVPARTLYAGRVQTVLTPAPSEGPRYRVGPAFTLTQAPPLFESANFLEAVDYAFEVIDREAPPALEIEKVDGDTRETVWTYSEKRAAAEAASKRSLVKTFGFDPTQWDAGASLRSGGKES